MAQAGDGRPPALQWQSVHGMGMLALPGCASNTQSDPPGKQTTGRGQPWVQAGVWQNLLNFNQSHWKPLVRGCFVWLGKSAFPRVSDHCTLETMKCQL